MNKFLYHLYQRNLMLVFALLLLQTLAAFGQAEKVSVTVNIIPPYSPYYADYSGSNASKVLLIIQNLTGTQQSVKLSGQLQGDNGIKLTTKSTYVPLQPIILNPNETKQLNGTALKDIFDLNTLNVYGVDKVKLIQTSRIPEGNYNFCVQAMDFVSGQLLSSSAPLGCTSFNIAYPEPPVLVSPLNASAVPETTPQTVVFNWMNPGTAPMGTQYTLQMAAMPDKVIKDPNQLLKETSFPLLQQTLNGFSYVYNISNLGLTPGKRYAWRVRATDPSGKTIFKNDGYSAASVFTYGDPVKPVLANISLTKEIPILIPSPDSVNKPILVNNKYALYLRWKLINSDEDVSSTGISKPAQLAAAEPLKYVIELKDRASNKIVDTREGLDLFYYTEKSGQAPVFKDGSSYEFVVKAYAAKGLQAGSKAISGIQLAAGKSALKDYTVLKGESKLSSFIYKKIADTLADLRFITLSGNLKYKFEQYTEQYPLNSNFQLNKYYRQLSADGKTVLKAEIDESPWYAFEPMNFTVNADKNGNFSTKVPLYTVPKGYEAYYVISYPGNKYYKSPKKEIVIDPNLSGDQLQAGEFVATAYSYQLNLHLTKGYKEKAGKVRVSEALDGLKVLLYRATKGIAVPKYEGQDTSMLKSLPKDKNVAAPAVLIASGTTKASNIPGKTTEAVVSFSRLLCAISNEDLYWIKVMDPKTGKEVINQPFNYRVQTSRSNDPVKYHNSAKKTGDYSYEVEKNLTWTVEEAPIATLKGRILYRYSDGVGGARPLGGTEISLKAFIVLQEKVGNKTYALPVKNMNALTFLDKEGQPKNAPTEEDKKFIGYINGISDNSIDVTKTKADGSFEFSKIPLWDSVFVSKESYSFYIPYPQIPVPPKEKPVHETMKDIWQSMLMGDDIGKNAAVKSFLDQIVKDAKNPLMDKFDPMAGQKLTGMPEGLDVTKGITATGQGQLNSGANGYQITESAISNVAKAGSVTKGLKQTGATKGGPFQLEELQLPDVMLKAGPSGIGPEGPCSAKLVYRVVITEGDIFCSPDNNIELNPLQQMDAGIMYSTVRSTRVRTRLFRGDEFAPEKGNENSQVLQMPVKLYHTNVDLVVGGEGETFNTKPTGEVNLVDQASSIASGILFSHILRGRSYTLKAVPQNESNNSTSYKSNEYNFSIAPLDKDITTQLGKNFLFNNDFTEEEVDMNLNLSPDEPAIAGRVLNTEGTKGLGNAAVVINYKTVVQVQPDGYFFHKSTEFSEGINSVMVMVPGYKPKLNNDSTKAGYYKFDVGKMSKGQKIFKNLYFKPSASIKGYVVNAYGRHIPSLYKTATIDYIQETVSECPQSQSSGNSGGGQTGQGFSYTGNLQSGNYGYSMANFPNGTAGNLHFIENLVSDCKQKFEAFTPMGAPAKLIIIPNDLKYFNDTLDLANVSSVQNNATYKRTLVTREHRIKFRVLGENNMPLKGAKVQILDTTMYTNPDGYAYCKFMNISESNFMVRVSPAAGQNYLAREFAFKNPETKDFVLKEIALSHGKSIGGRVFLDGQVLMGATVYVDAGSGTLPVKAMTNETGRYELMGLKINGSGRGSGQIKLIASGPVQNSGTILAQSRSIAADAYGDVDFQLKLLKGVDLNTLLGYRAIIESAVPVATGYTISGSIDLKNSKGDFTVSDPEMRIGFNDVKVNTIAGHGSQGLNPQPAGDISLDIKAFRARFKGAYNAQVFSPLAGIVLKKLSAQSGAFEVKAKIIDNSFDFPSSYMAFDNSEFYFATGDVAKKPGSIADLNSNFQAFSTASSPAVPAYYFTNAAKQAISFSLLQFPASTAPTETYFSGGKIRLLPVLKPSGINTLDEPLSISLPEVLIDKNSVSKINGVAPLEFKLDKSWTVVVPKWEFSTEEGGIRALSSSKNYIRTGALDIPFDTFRLRNDILMIDGVKADKIKLGGIVDLKLNAGTQSTFGIDTKIGTDLGTHYILRLLGKDGSNAATISGLAGFSTALDIAAVTLVSNGDQYVDFAANSKQLKTFGLIDFQPLMIESSPGDFKVLGNVDLGIPRLKTFYGGFKYTSLSNVSPDFKDIKFDIGKGYVVFNSPVSKGNADDNRKLVQQNLIQLYGTVAEPGQMEPVKVVLTRNAVQTKIDQNGPATFDYGKGTTMDVTEMKTSVVDKDWDYLTFTGRMRSNGKPLTNFKGDNPMPFKVYGEISSDDGKLALDGIGTPFGEMKLLFNWPKRELMGNLKIKNLQFGGVALDGEAEVAMGASGFYMLAAGNVNFGVSPFSPVKGGVLIGKYSNLDGSVYARAMQFNRNKVIPVCQGEQYQLAGMLVTGRKDLFEPIDFKLDLPPLLPLLSVRLAAEVGVDASMFLDFQDKPAITLAVGAFGSVNISASSITGTSASGYVQVDVTGNLKYQYPSSFKAKFFSGMKLGYSVTQVVPFFPDIHKSGSMDLSAEANFDTSASPAVKFKLSTEAAPAIKCGEAKSN